MSNDKINHTQILKTGDGHAHLVNDGRCTLCGKTREALEAERTLGTTPEGVPLVWLPGLVEPVSPSSAGLETVDDGWSGGDPAADVARAVELVRASAGKVPPVLTAGLGPDGQLAIFDHTKPPDIEITAYGHKLTGPDRAALFAPPIAHGAEPPALPVVLASIPTLNVWNVLDAEKSSNVEGWCFDHLRGLLTIKFRRATKAGHQVYVYPNTTGNEARDLMLSERPSKWVASWTKGRDFRVLHPFAVCSTCHRPIGEAAADWHGPNDETGEARCHLGPKDDRNILESMSAADAAAVGVQ